MQHFTDNNLYGVIGLGRFGTSLALELTDAGKDVIVLDIDEGKLQPLKDRIIHLYQIEQINREVLLEAGMHNCGTIIVCIGKDVESNLLATLNAIEIGVPRVIAKAMSPDHGRVLEKIGAEVVFPEVEMGARLAKSLVSKLSLDFLALKDDFSIVELELSSVFDGKTVLETDFRKKYHLNIIVVIHEDKVNGEITPDLVLHERDKIVVSGKNKAIAAFEKANGTIPRLETK